MPRSAYIVFGLLIGGFLAYLGMRYYDQQVAFFRNAETLKAHYKSHQDEYAALAAQFEKTPPVGENDLCLAPGCKHSGGGSLSSRRREQLEFYPAAIDAMDFAEGQFFRLTGDGELLTIPLSWDSNGYYVNARLHYTGGEAPDMSVCGKPPTDGNGGHCALPLSEAWFVRYDWMTASAFDPPAGTAEAACDSAKNESFAAYTACLENSDAPPAKLKCEHKGSDAEFNKCVQDLIDRAGGY